MSWTRISKNNNFYEEYNYDGVDLLLLKKFIDSNNVIAFKKDIGYGTTVLRFFQNGGKSCGKKFLQMAKLFGTNLIDHSMFFKTKEGKIIFTSQPYTPKDVVIEEFSQKFTSDFQLQIYDDSDSWYRPGYSLLFIITLKE